MAGSTVTVPVESRPWRAAGEGTVATAVTPSVRRIPS